MNIFLTRSAEQDLLDSLFADIDSLVLYAGIHPKPDGRFHRTLAKRFPYAVYYQMDGELVTVVAILDCRRNPVRIRNTLIERQ